MSIPPWGADRALTSEMAARAIGEAFPDIDVGNPEHLGSGWDFDAFRTADGWVFRFPRRAESQERFELERPILELVRFRLPADVAVPHVERSGLPGPHFPHTFAGHRHVDGVPADTVAAAHRPAMAAALGAVLGAIHAVPLDEARAAGVGELDRPAAGRTAWLRGGVAGLEALAGSSLVADRALAWVRAEPDPLRRLEAPVRFIHHDLSPEHLLVDPTSGRVTGILDWTDAILGDAARDFVILVAFGGWRFTRDVIDAYPHAIDSGFIDRLRFMARLLPAMWLGHASAKGEDVSRHLGWVANAFAE